MVNLGIIGCGHWGQNLVRSFVEVSDSNVYSVCDLVEERLIALKKRYPTLRTTVDYTGLIGNQDIEAIVIATSAKTHYRLAKEALLAGKHVLVEKPLALTGNECLELINIADKSHKILMLDHTFLYNMAVRKLQEYILSREIGDVYYIFSQRLNLGTIRRDVNALWNFAPHDVSIALYLLKSEPINVSAKGLCYIQDGVEDVAFLDISFKDGANVHIHVSWLDPLKVRRMVVVGSKKMVIYDDVNSDAIIQVYDKGVDKIKDKNSFHDLETFADFQLKLRAGDIYIPKIDFVEPLKVMCSHFIHCIEHGEVPLTDGRHGLKVVKILEAASLSMSNGGVPICLE